MNIQIRSRLKKLARLVENINFFDMCNESCVNRSNWTPKQQPNVPDDGKIKVGNEVRMKCYGKGFVTRVYNNTLSVTWLSDGTNGVVHEDAVIKTYRHYPQIAEMLKQAQEEKKMDELKKCPFCGKTPEVYRSSGKYFVTCVNEGCEVTARTITYDTEERAIEAWNKRGDAKRQVKRQ